MHGEDGDDGDDDDDDEDEEDEEEESQEATAKTLIDVCGLAGYTLRVVACRPPAMNDSITLWSTIRRSSNVVIGMEYELLL